MPFSIIMVNGMLNSWAQYCYKMWGGQLDLKPR